MRPLILLTLITIVVFSATIQIADAQHVCEDPPAYAVLTGETVAASGLDSEGHPATYAWYITPPDGPEVQKPTSTEPTHTFVLSTPGLWSVALVLDYLHQAPGGGLWSSETCLTIQASTVVSSIGLSDFQVTTDEALQLDGHQSQWATGVAPVVTWTIDGLDMVSCNGGPIPTTPGDLGCTVPADWLLPGWHSAGLLLTDPASGESSLDAKNFEVIEVVPLSVDFTWSPAEPDPGQVVLFGATVTPLIPEEDLISVTWDLGNGTVWTHTSCPPVFFSTCLEWPEAFATDGWYDVTVTVETSDETASRTYQVEVGDPDATPVASFTSSPTSPYLLAPANLNFDGTCIGVCSWSWDFDDGSHSTTQNPSHAWNVPMTYSVSLTVTNPAGSDTTSRSIVVGNCWNPGSPVQQGSCYGGQVHLTAPIGAAWSWNTGETSRTIAAPFAGSYWVNIDNGSSCWGHGPSTVVLGNCGDPEGDTNLDGSTDGSDLAALIPELTDGDGDTVVGAGGGDLTAPGGDVNSDDRLRTDDLLTVLDEIFG